MADDRFVTSAWEAVHVLTELLEHRKKARPTGADFLYDATLVERANRAVAAMRHSTDAMTRGQVADHGPHPSERVEVVHFRKAGR